MDTIADVSTFDLLPTEIMYRILDLLDIETILVSFAYVCKRFHCIVQEYKNYKIDLQSISKANFHSICRAIRPENIQSIILSNDSKTPGQIKRFFSKFQIKQFTRLKSLKLIEIDEDTFNQMFQSDFTMPSSLSFTIQNKKSTSLPLILSIISNENLRSIDFFLSSYQINSLLWPNQCFIQTLILSNVINIQLFTKILSSSIYLKKIVVPDCTMTRLIDDGLILKTFPQLTSLTFYESDLTLEQCEVLLSLIPSLEYFQIVGGIDLFDGYRWEQLIKTKLLKLKQFQFALFGYYDIESRGSPKIHSLIAPFRTTFWIEDKHWFVLCYYFLDSSYISLYSLPICNSNVRFFPAKNKISCSTYPNKNVDDTWTYKINAMQLDLTDLIKHDVQNNQDEPCEYLFFQNLNKLALTVYEQWPVDSNKHLSTFINLSSIANLTISIKFHQETLAFALTDITNLLKQTINLNSLTFDSLTTNSNFICSLVPQHVKHLQVTLNNIDDIKSIIERLTQLSSLTFQIWACTRHMLSDFILWLKRCKSQSTYRTDAMYLSIWLDNSVL